MPLDLNRRSLLLGAAGSVGAAGLLSSAVTGAFPVCTDAANQICNITRLYSVTSAGIITVKDVDDIRQAMQGNERRFSIGGGRYSMGGQTATPLGAQLDMRAMNRLVWIKPDNKTARVQAGMRWRDLQTVLDPLNLSVQTMQSYANFTVGGAVSVNCHGRYVGHGAVVHSVISLQLILATGQTVEANRKQNTELFFAAIGGYGAVGVITEIELQLDYNTAIERYTQRVALLEYDDWFKQTVLNDPNAVLHNADLIPPNFDMPFCVTWHRTAKPLTDKQRLTPAQQSYRLEKAAIWAATEWPNRHYLRRVTQGFQEKPAVVWRNKEASLDVAELEPATRSMATYVLQEYFVPVRHFKPYAKALSIMMSQFNNDSLNISMRHSKADHQSLLSWANESVFCFVIYYKQRVTIDTESRVKSWTQALIDLAIKYEGKYYLPYQPHATQAQFERAYPQLNELRRLRADTNAARFSNVMWERYGV
jgi:FAD/FMN-containing dehydrogenase